MYSRDCSGSASMPQQAEQARDDPRDLVAQVLLGGLEGHGGRLERLQDVQGDARACEPGV